MDNPETPNQLDQYTMLSVIGKGSYAKVVLIKKKDNGKLYALKSMKKKYIAKKKQQGRVVVEKEILATIKHPFLVNMSHAFQNQSKLFLVLEYCPGGELFGLLSKRKRLTQNQTKFYAAQMILALEYLHANNIIYRDLKPENVLIDAEGYIKLTDFGLSKNNVYGEKDTFSVCGTPEYLAPEVIKKEGHGKAVDWWCLGSIIYELIHGLPPFYHKNRSQLFQKIKNQQPYLSVNWSIHLKDLLNGLFEKDPEIRMQKVMQIKNHPWFAQIDWQKLINKQIKSPFVPKIEGQLDTQNFDRQFTQCSIESEMSSLGQGKNLQGFSFQRSPIESQKNQMGEQVQISMQIEAEMD